MKTVIDLDPDLIEAAAKVLGTTTMADTVHAALAAAIAEAERKAQRRARLINSAGWPDLGDDAGHVRFDSIAADRAAPPAGG